MQRSLLAGLLCGALMAGFARPCAFALNPTEAPRDYILTRWDTENGLPHNAIRQIYQTREGFLWIGTSYGLARFDGLAFTVFTKINTPGFIGGQTTSMAETDDGSFWISTSDGLIRYLNGKFTSYSTADGLKTKTINALCRAPDGSLWIGCRNGITRWANEKFINDIDTSAYDTSGLRNIVVDRQNDIWIASGSTALRYRKGAFARFGSAEGIATDRVERIREGMDGEIVAVTEKGLYRREGERFVPFPQNEKLSSLRVGTTLFDRAGNLWVGSVGGLDRINESGVVPYSDRYGRKLGVVDVIFEDREGCLWLGTPEGLYRMTDRRAHTLALEGTPLGLTTVVKQTRENSLWIATWSRGVDRIRDGKVTHYLQGAPLSHHTVTKIHEDPNGVIWLGNRGSAIDRLEDGKATTYVYQPGVVTSRPVTAMLTDDQGTLLIGIDKRGLLQLLDGKIVPVPEMAEWATNWQTHAVTVWVLHRTRDGRLLMGTSNGLFQRRADRTWAPITLPYLSGTVVTRSILEDADGTLWLATEGNGLVRWEKNQARSFGSREGMIDDTLFHVVDDGHGFLWALSARGIARIRKSEFAELDHHPAATLRSMRLSRGDGLLSSSPSGYGDVGMLLSDGRLMFATDQSVAVVDPARLQPNNLPPTVVIERVVVDDRPVEMNSVTSLAAGTSKLEFRYTGLSLIAPERLLFRYKLEGSDARWVDAGNERVARYTHLGPGTYTFRVLACNSDGVWNETGASLAVTILPYFHQTLWFRLSAVALFAAGVIGIFRLRVRHLRQREVQLERTNTALDQRVRERTTELSRSNEELRQRELLFRLIFEHAPVGISWKRADLSQAYHFNPTFRRILELPTDTSPDYSLLNRSLHPEDAVRQAEMNRLVETGQTDSYTIEQRFVLNGERTVWGLLSVAVIRDQTGRIVQDIGILEEITARKLAEQELANTYKNLVSASRMAGMAEVATGVLHNVGNVLNSLNVSATVISTGLKQSKTDSFTKVSAMLRENAADLGQFITQDPKGRLIPGFIESLAVHFTEEQGRLVKEVASLQSNIDHIKDIVTMQQAYATSVHVIESLPGTDLMEDALRMNTSALARHDVSVRREYLPAPNVQVEKTKVLQILINVIRNAKYACDDQHTDAKGQKIITVRVEPGAEGMVRLIVSDNGVGIAPENITRIFGHGFTTRAYGHGFGLHSAAIAAKEMKGSLIAQSGGVGKGATFILELPIALAVATSVIEKPAA